MLCQESQRIVSRRFHGSGIRFCEQFHGCAGIQDAKTRERAEQIARDLIEYINSIDYQKYYDAMGRPGSRGGDKEKQFSDFSIRACDAAQVPSFAHALLLSVHPRDGHHCVMCTSLLM